MGDIPADMLGPKMMALRDDRQRRFAWIMGCAETNSSQAARDAGYSDPGGESSAIRVQAHSLMHNDAILAAIEEVSRKVLRGLAPLAIRAAKQLLEDPKHPAHARMIETVMDRTGFFAESRHTMTVEHTVDTRELEQLARRLALENGIDPKRLLGTNAPVIEGEVAVDLPTDE